MVNVGTKTFNLKREEIKRKWYVVEATDKILGRLATDRPLHRMLIVVIL